MASLNLSSHGPSITKSYKSIVDAPAPSGPAAASQTYGQWALFAVSAPLVNAFQQDAGNKESVLKVQSTGEGELADLIDEFSDGRIQFAFVKVKDPNTGLPKNALIAWCGEGVPERTKGYFTSHLAAVSKLLYGYHVQIAARSERDLTPEGIIQKIADSSGSKYSAGSEAPSVGTATKPITASKPAFTPTQSSSGGGYTPTARNRPSALKQTNVDEDGWGVDAPPVTRTQLEKVPPAYQPTKVNMKELSSQNQPGTLYTESQRGSSDPEVVKGTYQPVGKVDIAALRRQAQESGALKDEKPEIVRGSYEPVGKVDIAAIRARAQKPSEALGSVPVPSKMSGGDEPRDQSRLVSERSAAFSSSERLTSLPKPKIANKFGGSSSFTGTRAPVPGGFEAKPISTAAPVGSASRTFADQGGKTPAQIWAEKKARERGLSGSTEAVQPSYSGHAPLQSETSGGGEWRSGYTGKSWAPVKTTPTGKSNGSSVEHQKTDEVQSPAEGEAPRSPAGGIGSIRDRFSEAPPMRSPAPSFERPAPDPDTSNKPNRGIPIPGLPMRPSGGQAAPTMPSPPPQPPRSPTPPTPEMRPASPIRVAIPVARGPEPEVADAHKEQLAPPPAMPVRSMEQHVPEPESEDDEPDAGPDPARTQAQTTAAASFGQAAVQNMPSASSAAGGGGGKRALVQYDYEAAEDNEIGLKEGEYVTNVDMVDEDWWMGENARGQVGLFPSNYVELVEEEDDAAPVESAPSAPAPSARPAAPPGPTKSGPTATAMYDYEAAEDNELGFPEGAKITNLEFPDEDWWLGEYNGKSGLFPANYVQLDE